MFNKLQENLSKLQNSNSSIEVSYALGLTREEQIKYAKIGLFWLQYDVKNYASEYNNQK